MGTLVLSLPEWVIARQCSIGEHNIIIILSWSCQSSYKYSIIASECTFLNAIDVIDSYSLTLVTTQEHYQVHVHKHFSNTSWLFMEYTCIVVCTVLLNLELDTLILLYTHQKLTQDQLIANLAMKEVTDAFTTENQYYYW